MNRKIGELIQFIYGKDKRAEVVAKVETFWEERAGQLSPPANRGEGFLPLDEEDVFLITYGDNLGQPGKKPLVCLNEFLTGYLKDIFSGVHILPFFPYSSDDGFSIIDYLQVNPDLGSWDDVASIGEQFKLAADHVLNHCSAKSRWFQAFLDGKAPYKDYFITMSADTDLSMIARPRALPLLTPFETAAGKKLVWTTFSADQVDLNFANPDVLLEMINVFFTYIKQGVQLIRLDAIAYLWKEPGHPSIHHPKTHAVVKLFRALLKEYAPWVVILTETNVPHEENISYFGDGTDEAQMVYQFSLPPLVLDAFLRENANHLRQWAATLFDLGGKVTFFNFLASHDGVGMLPANGILTELEKTRLMASVKERGGLISYKATPQGEIPYELNVNYCDAVAEKNLDDESRAAKFLASQSLMLSLVGVPGIYIHSLIGSDNFTAGVKETGRNRTINREKLNWPQLRAELDNPRSFRACVFNGYVKMLKARRQCRAFHPGGRMIILEGEGPVFPLLRIPPPKQPGESERPGKYYGNLLCLHNVSGRKVQYRLKKIEGQFTDLLSNRKVAVTRQGDELIFSLDPYQVLWLRYQ